MIGSWRFQHRIGGATLLSISSRRRCDICPACIHDFFCILTFSRAWSVSIGRVSQLPREAIAIDLPKDLHSNDTWQAINDESRYSQPVILRCDDAQLLHHFVKLSVIVGELMTMFYAPSPRARMTSGRVRSFYQQLKGWYKTLPLSLRLSDEAPPHIYIFQYVIFTLIKKSG